MKEVNQKKQKNKGFTLVELIVVIAILAILVGVLAPQYLRYIERTRVSTDIQVADSVRTALLTALADPNVDAVDRPAAGTFATLGAVGGATFQKEIAATLGVTGADAAGISKALDAVIKNLKSTPAGATPLAFKITISATNQVTVEVLNGLSAIKVGP